MKRRRWTAQEVALLRDMYPHISSGDIARQLGITLGQVYAKANKLGLRKTRDYLVSMSTGKLSGGTDNIRSWQFKRGGVPWNKGMKGMAPLSPKSVFQPGNRSGQALHNWMPVGSTRVNSDGYLVRKIADVPAAQQHKNWRAEHRLVWEAKYGPVPAGHAVVFKPGRHSTRAEDITPDALEMITRAELMHRNSVQRYPDDLRRLVQLRGALTRMINQHAGDKAPAQTTTEDTL